jgi:hypothetical protein
MSKKQGIPKSFRLFGTTVDVVFDNNSLNQLSAVGGSAWVQSKITLTDTHKGEKVSEDVIEDTFYHEKVHAILDSMGKHDLSQDEEFVNVFSRLLRQSDVTAKY